MYPSFHPLHRRAQARRHLLSPPSPPPHQSPEPRGAEAAREALLARAATATGCSVVLHPGDVLSVPWGWWHEVTILPPDSADGLVVGLHFVFDPAIKLSIAPPLPLSHSGRVELAYQLEMFLADSLGSARYVSTFLCGMQAQLRQLQPLPSGKGHAEAAEFPIEKTASEISTSEISTPEAPGMGWEAIQACCPPSVPPAEWCGLCEYVVFQGSLLLGPQQLLPFLVDLCAPERFAAC